MDNYRISVVLPNSTKTLYRWLSDNPNITWDIVQNNPDKPWDYRWLSNNPNITWDIVEANPDKPWNYKMLSQNKMTKHPFYKGNCSTEYVLK